MAQRVRQTEIAADELHVLIHTVGPRNADELQAAFTDLLSQHPEALLVTTEPFTRRYRIQIFDFASTNNLPVMYEESSWVDAGGLMSYGPDYQENFRTAALLVDKILKGAKPADLPIEQPTTFELVLNLKTAKAIGRDIPAKLLALANGWSSKTRSSISRPVWASKLALMSASGPKRRRSLPSGNAGRATTASCPLVIQSGT